MIFKTINFSENPNSCLEAYIHSPHDELKIGKRKAIIVCPGGGYEMLSEREAEPIALQYFAAGLNAFVLRYPIRSDAKDYAPLIEACLAIRYLRKNCDELYVDPDFIYITGFSAGGHLAASAGTLWHIDEVQKLIGDDAPEICKPTATILCYPVITNNQRYRHKGSILTVNGYRDDEESMNRFSLDDLVDEKTAPAFLWHTAKDSVVPVQNSLLYATKLAEYRIPFELHIHPNGDHGLALCNEETWSQGPGWVIPYNENWIKYAIKWVKEAPFKN